MNVSLLQFFRNPELIQHQEFSPQYIENVRTILKNEMKVRDEAEIYAIYMHLVLAQVHNLFELEALGEERKGLRKIGKEWNLTNVMNAHCIRANIRAESMSEKETHISNRQPKNVQMEVQVLSLIHI